MKDKKVQQHPKVLALDLGDQWIGVAISDSLNLFAKPFTTVCTPDLLSFLHSAIQKHHIGTIVVGYPRTLRGTHSQQTEKVLQTFDALKNQFTTVDWQLFDERLSSKQASLMKKERTKEDRIASHARAAAIILYDYLEHKRFEQAKIEQNEE